MKPQCTPQRSKAALAAGVLGLLHLLVANAATRESEWGIATGGWVNCARVVFLLIAWIGVSVELCKPGVSAMKKTAIVAISGVIAFVGWIFLEQIIWVLRLAINA
jgi:hypothetical protein